MWKTHETNNDDREKPDVFPISLPSLPFTTSLSAISAAQSEFVI